MTTPFTVALTGERPNVELHRAVLSSVPDRFRPTEHGGDVALVDASATGWAEKLETAARQRVRGTVVAAAGTADDPDAVRTAGAVAREAGVVVVVDRPHSMDRAWRPDRLSTATLSASTYQISGTAGAVRISLSAARGPHSTLALDLVGGERRRQARFDGLGLAAPARIGDFDQHGARTGPLHYESPHRVAWLELHAALTGVAHPRHDLDELAEDIALVRRLLDTDGQQ
jgi:hypothetical protein